jgi:beta-glucanase (GH16 family)
VSALAGFARRRLVVTALAVLVVLAGVGGGILLTGGGSSSGWTKVWSFTFNGPAGARVSRRYWTYDTGYGIFGSGEIETMTSSAANVHLDGHGALDITAIGRGSSWTSGRIQTTSSRFAAPAGGEMIVTASIRQPDPSGGLGYWPALWLLGPGQWPEDGEIDIMEDVNARGDVSGTLHCGNLTQHNPDGTTGPCHEPTGLSSGLKPCAGCDRGYHTYTVVVDRRRASDQQIRWYLDGHRFFSVDESQVGGGAWVRAVDHGFSIILDLAIGGRYPDNQCRCTTPTSGTTSGGTMSVRYVSVDEIGPDRAS